MSNNPLMPSGFDIAMAVLTVIAVVLLVIALVSVARSRLSLGEKVVAALFVILLPILGPSTWLALSAHHRRRQHQTTRGKLRAYPSR